MGVRVSGFGGVEGLAGHGPFLLGHDGFWAYRATVAPLSGQDGGPKPET